MLTKRQLNKMDIDKDEVIRLIEKHKLEPLDLVTSKLWKNKYDLDPEVRYAVIKNNPMLLKCIINPTSEECLLAVENQSMSIIYIPKKEITSEMAKLIAINNPTVLQRVPKELITEEIAIIALKEDVFCARWIPDEIFLKVLGEVVLSSSNSVVRALNRRRKVIENNGASINN